MHEEAIITFERGACWYDYLCSMIGSVTFCQTQVCLPLQYDRWVGLPLEVDVERLCGRVVPTGGLSSAPPPTLYPHWMPVGLPHKQGVG